MSDPTIFHGKCLCGEVSVTANKIEPKVGACHCSMCRKWGAGPFMGVDCGSEVEFSNEDSITCFDSSEWAERGFCKKCGTHLFYRLKQSNQHILPIDIFDKTPELI
ncbi:MAG: GFA family protein, partial [Kangiellaceae bacterium]|nr:GFA family protein [Kangiellaceae bacterium]